MEITIAIHECWVVREDERYEGKKPRRGRKGKWTSCLKDTKESKNKAQWGGGLDVPVLQRWDKVDIKKGFILRTVLDVRAKVLRDEYST